MTPAHALRLAAIVYLLLLVASSAATADEASTLPEPLRTWRTANPLPQAYELGGGGALLGTIVASLGLLRRRRWAAHLHLASTLLWMALALFVSAGVSSGSSALLVSSMLLTSGFIYGLAFFTDALDPAEPVAAAHDDAR